MAGHPRRAFLAASKTWMAGSSPAKTECYLSDIAL